MKIDPFAPESARESVETLYPLKAIRLGTVNALPPISLLRSNSARQTFLPRTETSPRDTLSFDCSGVGFISLSILFRGQSLAMCPKISQEKHFPLRKGSRFPVANSSAIVLEAETVLEVGVPSCFLASVRDVGALVFSLVPGIR